MDIDLCFYKFLPKIGAKIGFLKDMFEKIKFQIFQIKNYSCNVFHSLWKKPVETKKQNLQFRVWLLYIFFASKMKKKAYKT